jgi:N-acetylmuramoyl-L-alanine amidase
VGPRTAVVTASLLFLRQGPGLNQAVLARLHAGQRVTLLGTRGAWDHVRSGSATGWAFGRWLSLKKA